MAGRRRNADDRLRRAGRTGGRDPNRIVTEKIRTGRAGEITLGELSGANAATLEALRLSHEDEMNSLRFQVLRASGWIDRVGNLDIPVLMQDQLGSGNMSAPISARLIVTPGGQISLEIHSQGASLGHEEDGQPWPHVGLIEHAEGEIRILPYNRHDPEGQPFNVVAVYPRARALRRYAGGDL